MNNAMIGIVGGIGSYAGLDLIKKVYDHTDASCDQEHLPVTMLSAPHKVSDRTEFLLGNTATNPGIAIADIIDKLALNGANVIGIPCNTAHAESIFNEIKRRIPSHVKVLHLINEVAKYIHENYPHIKTVGLLATTGTISSKVYVNILRDYGIKVIIPTENQQEQLVHPAIYDSGYGIKSNSNPVTEKSKNQLLHVAKSLVNSGAQAVILGCTEIPLAITEKHINHSIVLDATEVLAEALIKSVNGPISLSTAS